MLENLRRIYHVLKGWPRFFKTIHWFLLNACYKFGWLNIYAIPVVVNNFNRLTVPEKLLQFITQCGFTNIIVIDNNSTYPPLLDFYDFCNYKVIRSANNYGHLALWKSGLYKRIRWNYFIYTDSDVLPVEECPSDFIKYFKDTLDADRSLDKVGFGIKIDDLPDSFSLKERVVRHETGFWAQPISPGIYKAKVDTTFALYRPFSNLKFGETHTLSSVRLGPPFILRHMPWYTDSANPTEEEKFFLMTSNSSSSIARQYRTGDIY